MGKKSSSNMLDAVDGEDEGVNFSKMGEKEILKEFEKMLENMNLTEEKKEPLRRIQSSKKREMLTMNNKKTVARVNNSFSLLPFIHFYVQNSELDSPADYINYLSNPELSLVKKSSCTESLRVALTNNSLEWVQEFGNKGLEQVLDILNKCFSKCVYFF